MGPVCYAEYLAKTMTQTTFLRGAPLFASPLLVFEISGAAELNRRLITETAAIRAGSSGLQRSNRNGWHSEIDFFNRTEPGCRELCAAILESVKLATLRVAPSFDFEPVTIQAVGWINVNGKGGFNSPHTHPGWAWSGSYYVAVPPAASGTDGAIEFLDPRVNVRTVAVHGADCFNSRFTLRPEPGTLLMFPSYLCHWVYPNEQDSDRISVAFNARFAPRMPAGAGRNPQVGGADRDAEATQPTPGDVR